MKPIYRVEKSYAENFRLGPDFEGRIESRAHLNLTPNIDFLGYKINAPLGIPAGPLLDSRWIELAGRLNWSVLTYKTVRTYEYSGHPFPNVIPIKNDRPFNENDLGNPVLKTDFACQDFKSLSITNSFGMPSPKFDFWVEDVRKAKKCLGRGQVLMVSVVGSGATSSELLKDFSKAAGGARDSGADIIELNFSCPNTCSGSDLYLDPVMIKNLVKEMSGVAGSIPLAIKVGYFKDKKLMREVLIVIAKSGGRAVCGINTIKLCVLDESGSPALGEKRKFCGICGSAIKNLALDFVKLARTINEKEKLGLTIMGTGGVWQNFDFDDFLRAGADIAMSATGMMWNPYLAEEFILRHSCSFK